MTRLLVDQHDEPVLDVCTGTGDLAFAYALRTRGTAAVVGTDFTHEMLVLAEGKGQRRPTHDARSGAVSFLEADTQRLPFADDTFQIVCVAFGLRNVADTDAGLAEMTRVCAPGGKVAVLEFSTPTWQPFKAIYGWYFRNVLPMIGRVLSKSSADAYNYLPTSVGEFPQGEELADRMRATGLTDVTRTTLTLGVATLYVGTK